MEKELSKAFKNARYKEKSGLSLNVWNNILLRNKRIAYIKLWAFSSIGVASLIGLFPAWQILSNDLTQSGFYEYLSLIFSNGSSITSYWQELSLSIIESLPTMSIVLSLSLIFIILMSIKYIAKQIINNSNMGNTYGIA
ncbi:MAG: hypothetical protein WCS86_02285 [Candidatus Paceibacterota bacterium]